MIAREVEYLSTCRIGRHGKLLKWRTGKLIRVWKDGSASVQPPEMTNGWLILKPNQWREKR